jgi:hypothetical protein
MDNQPSLCIPRTDYTITKEYVACLINKYNFGEIERIDMVKQINKKGEKYQQIFIHFKTWFSNELAVKTRERLLEGKEIKIIYDNPWFWKIFANKSIKKY